MNTKEIKEILKEYDSTIHSPAPLFIQYIKSQKPKTKEDVIKAFKKSFELGWDY